MTLLFVCLGAAVGAPARYLADRAIRARHDTRFPWGTFTVNVVGSLVLGVLAGVAVHHAVSPAVVAVVGAGFCGALTTYSAFGYETVRLAEHGARVLAALNVVASLAAGVGAVTLGYLAGRTF
jgi:CrcB protein